MCTYKCVGKCWNLPLCIAWVEWFSPVTDSTRLSFISEMSLASALLLAQQFWGLSFNFWKRIEYLYLVQCFFLLIKLIHS